MSISDVWLSLRCPAICKLVQGATNHRHPDTSGTVYMDAVLSQPTSKRELESVL